MFSCWIVEYYHPFNGKWVPSRQPNLAFTQKQDAKRAARTAANESILGLKYRVTRYVEARNA